ncbi:hypothetical protein [Paraburkholderia sacchari]|uniref:hypothetical protein n=1 Tax=Paraburkholderia sacchari TaxID=159450 RepID=UPI003D96759B
MKSIATAAVIALVLWSATAAMQTMAETKPKSHPFAYSEDPGVRVFYYKKKCEAAGVGKEWHYAVYHFPAGYWPGCWRIPTKRDLQHLAEVCPLHVADGGAIGMGDACILAGSRGIFDDPDGSTF